MTMHAVSQQRTGWLEGEPWKAKCLWVLNWAVREVPTKWWSELGL